MDGYEIAKTWLTTRVERGDPEWDWAIEQLRPEEGDEIWHFDEPAPPGINAGAIGLALVRSSEVIRTSITGVH